MLRSSLRSSQKLQQLASHPVPTGVVNEAFSVEESQSGLEQQASADTPSKVIGRYIFSTCDWLTAICIQIFLWKLLSDLF